MRYAIFFTPPPADMLTSAAVRWIGRDAFTDEMVTAVETDGLQAEEIAEFTASARKYGFHATLKPPFELAPGKDEAMLLTALQAFCEQTSPFVISPLKLGQLGPFFALIPEEDQPRLNDFAATVVREFEPFRAPLSKADIARRNPELLNETQRENLHQWGYPYVFESFRFHMTLAGPVDEPNVARFSRALSNWFNPILGIPVAISTLTLFVEPAPGEPFQVHTQIPLGASAERKTD